MVNLGGVGAAITWATADTGFNNQTLILGASTATHTVDLQNALVITTARTVQVDDGAMTKFTEDLIKRGNNGQA